MDDFFSRAEAQWPQQGRLHVYATPTDELRRVVADYQATLGRTPAADFGIGLVPPPWLHATVQMLRVAADQLDEGQHDALITALRREVAAVGALEWFVGPPQVSAHAVEVWIEPTVDRHWLTLVEAVRAAVRDVLGEVALPQLGPNAVPHMSLGYGLGAGDSGQAMSLLKGRRRPGVRVPITAVQLVDVTQHPEEGYFSWGTLAELPLAAAEDR